jgi:hypothetical protein
VVVCSVVDVPCEIIVVGVLSVVVVVVVGVGVCVGVGVVVVFMCGTLCVSIL